MMMAEDDLLLNIDQLVREEIRKSRNRSIDELKEDHRKEAHYTEKQIENYIIHLGQKTCDDSLIVDASRFLASLIDDDTSSRHFDFLDKRIVELAVGLFPYLINMRYWSYIVAIWDRLIPKTIPNKYHSLYVKVLTQKAIAQSNLGNYKEAIATYEKILNSNLDNELSNETIAGVKLQKGVSLFRIGDSTNAEKLLLETFAFCQQFNLPTQAANILIQLGNISVEKNKYSSALSYYQKSLHYVSLSDKAEGLDCMALQGIGRMLVIEQKYEEAIPFLLEAIHLRKKRGEKSELAHVMIDLATAHSEIGNLVEAETQISGAYEICRAHLDVIGEVLCHIAKGRLFFLKRLKNDAFNQWKLAISKLRNKNMPQIELWLYSKYLPSLLISGNFFTAFKIIPNVLQAINRIKMRPSTVAGYLIRLSTGFANRIIRYK